MRFAFAFAFDFDGVILDSLSALRKCYLDFLARYGHTGTEMEFASLNGPSLPEIVSILKRKYGLVAPEDELLLVYKRHLRENYFHAPLVENAAECLVFLKNRGIFLALVTSSLRADVDKILERHGIHHLFDFIVTGDEVLHSKPSPEIYSKLRVKFPQYSFWAVEDSYNGLISAERAGLRTIYFDPDGVGTELSVDCRVSSLDIIKTRAVEMDYKCCVMERSGCIDVTVESDFFPDVTDDQKAKVDSIWQDALEKRPLYDDQILYYNGHSSTKDRCVVRAFWGPYRFFFASRLDKTIGIPFVPLAVSGVCLDLEGRILIARRKNVTEYEGGLELAPSGGISRRHAAGSGVSYENQLKEELLEEVGFKSENILSARALGLVRDLNHHVIDVVCLIELQAYTAEVLKNTVEYERLQWVERAEIDERGMVPASVGLLSLLGESRGNPQAARGAPIQSQAGDAGDCRRG